ncbi:hypothetical protein [Methylobacterium brachiatum]|nr:hypothetical protein [Methylobacterium brachiatum]MDH2313126.1 hypothetical protein [Methylobacterium brachiatum]
MSASQRAALLDLCAAILRCDCAAPDIRFRARNLQICVALSGTDRSIFC